MRWIILVFTSLLLFFSCKKIERINPVDGIVGVQTSTVQQLDLSSVQIGSTLQVTEEVPYVTQRGVCWSMKPNPTTANDFIAQGNGFGTFQSKITGLAANTTYYFRSFASNEKTTAYGNEVSFTTSNTNTMINGVEFVNIPSGTFTMGSPSNEVDRSSSEQQHQVTLSAFKMSKNEITFTQYDAFCDATGRTKPDDYWGRGNRPVINVSWNDAKAFADWMGCRLPTEAEWEYACRAGTTTPFNSGNNLTTNQANYNGNYPYNGNQTGVYLGKTQSVGSYPSNAWGLNDMHGNVWEWCSDWHDDYGTGSQTNPTGPSAGSYRVYRGGGWGFNAQYCRSSKRGGYYPSYSINSLGFRLVAP